MKTQSILLLMLLSAAFAGCVSRQEKTESKAAPVSEKEAIRLAVRDHMVEVHHCYRVALDDAPKAGGQLVVDWELDSEGRVVSATADLKSSTLKNQDISECVLTASKKWIFPKAPQGIRRKIKFPLTFDPGGTKDS